MTSKIKVDNINKVSDDSNIIKKCGTTTTIGSGASNPIVVDGSAITLGRCGGTVALASGATQTGFGRTGTVDWQTGSIKTATFTAANGEGYFCNTSGGAFTVNLPAGSAGAIVSVSDYTRTFATNNLTISPNGSEKIGGIAGDAVLNINGQAATFVYVDGTEGWINVQETQTSQTGSTGFIMATGGTETTCGNCKIHTFTGPGTFEVTGLANTPANNAMGYMVVAGGGGGGGELGGGGGAGGFREGRTCSVTPYSVSPLAVATGITATVTSYPITAGGGGAGSTQSPIVKGDSGSPSIFSTITSAGGGGGGTNNSSPGGATMPGIAGGSGGGGAGSAENNGGGGAGNTPPVSPAQGFAGGTGSTSGPNYGAAGGGGATAAGANSSGTAGGAGGAGATTSINATPTIRAGGGGGAVFGCGGTAGAAGPGGGGAGGNNTDGTNGTDNTGGGGGGARGQAGNGGSGVVIIRYKFQ